MKVEQMIDKRSERAKSGAAAFEIFEYPACCDASKTEQWEGWTGLGAGIATPPESPSLSAAREPAACIACRAHQRAEFETEFAAETRRAVDATRESSRHEGRLAEREAHAESQAMDQERRTRQAVELIDNFARERDRYFHTVEQEVVNLSLAVATRILRREAQMDPLLLTGAVRVALGQLSSTTEVRLRVPPGEFDLWEEVIAHMPNLMVRPLVAAGEGMRLGECIIETELGSVDLGIRAQLGEIERGFFDRTGASALEAADCAVKGGPS